MNKAILMGRLVRDPEMRYGANGNAVASFSVAVDRRFKREGQPDADFFNCVAFGKQGEFVEKYLKKGTKILLEGEIQNNDYTNKDGQKVHNVQIVCNSIEFAESRNAQGGQQTSQPQETRQADTSDFLDIPDDIDAHLPF